MFLNTWTQLLSNSTSWAVLLEKETESNLFASERTLVIPYIATDVSYHNRTDLFNCAENSPQFHSFMVHNGGRNLIVVIGRKNLLNRYKMT